MNPNLFERILVPTDLSAFDDLAVRYALLFNERLGSKITLFHAQEISWLAAEHPAGYYFENPMEAKEELQARLADYARRMTPETARVATIFADSDPVAGILRAADETHADLIVMATHARSGFRRAVIGSVTESVLHHAKRPVITVAPRLLAVDQSVRLRTILCPVNFSGVARAALEQATALAESFDAELIVLHVAESGISSVEPLFAQWVDPLLRDRTRYRQIVVKGDAAPRVLEVADQVDADLLVVGAQHKFLHDATVLGTTTEHITRFARHAVMTVMQPTVGAVDKPRELLTV